jgi:peptide subunit release factor 1 (eRF1)
VLVLQNCSRVWNKRECSSRAWKVRPKKKRNTDRIDRMMLEKMLERMLEDSLWIFWTLQQNIQAVIDILNGTQREQREQREITHDTDRTAE